MDIQVDKEIEADFPVEGKIYLHNDGVDAVAAQPDFDELDEHREEFKEAFEGLKGFMYEVSIGIRLYRNGDIDILSVNGKEVDNR